MQSKLGAAESPPCNPESTGSEIPQTGDSDGFDDGNVHKGNSMAKSAEQTHNDSYPASFAHDTNTRELDSDGSVAEDELVNQKQSLDGDYQRHELLTHHSESAEHNQSLNEKLLSEKNPEYHPIEYNGQRVDTELVDHENPPNTQLKDCQRLDGDLTGYAVPHFDPLDPEVMSNTSSTASRSATNTQRNIYKPRANLEDVNDIESPNDASSFRDFVKSRQSSSSISSPSPRALKGLSLAHRRSRSGSINNSKVFQRSPSSSSAVTRDSPVSLTRSRASSSSSKESVNPEGSAALSDGSYPGSRIPSTSEPRVSPLDNLDLLLSEQSPVPHIAKTTNTRLPMRLGLLSFDEDDYEQTEHNTSMINGELNDRSKSKFSNIAGSGVRRYEDRIRKLETENMELRLKLQQYREMNASEQEITRVKWQVDRAERRIDELEQALERKNHTILELSKERDLLASKVRPEHDIQDLQLTISELQTAITELESQSIAVEESERATSAAITGLCELMPDIIAPGAAVNDLVEAVKRLHSENIRLTEIEQTHNKVTQLLKKCGTEGDNPISGTQSLIETITELQHELQEIKEVLSHERETHSQDIHLLKDSQDQRVDSLLETESKLRQQLVRTQSVQATLEDKVNELEEIVENQHKIVSDTRADNYGLVRRFFSELIEVMGTEFQVKVEQELQSVIETAQRQGVSKLPLLTDLLLRYTREMAEEAVRSYTTPAVDLKVRAMEQEVQSLEHMLAIKLDKNGADSILLAQNRDLRRALKLEQEKRKTDWNEYTKTIAAIR